MRYIVLALSVLSLLHVTGQRPGAPPSFSKTQKIWSRSEPRRSGRLSVTYQRLKAALSIAWIRKSHVICAVLAMQLIIMTIGFILLGQRRHGILKQPLSWIQIMLVRIVYFCIGSIGRSFFYHVNWCVSPVICRTHLRAHDTQSVQVRSV